MKANEQRSFLLAAADWQESLLQNYRSFHCTIQSILLATCSTVFAVQLATLATVVNSSTQLPLVHTCYTLTLITLLYFQKRTSTDMYGVISSRARDIDYWHKAIILCENQLVAGDRNFTHFKVWQRAQRQDVSDLFTKYMPVEGVTAENAEEILGKGVGHTRRVLDVNLFLRLHYIFIGITILSLVISALAWIYGN